MSVLLVYDLWLLDVPLSTSIEQRTCVSQAQGLKKSSPARLWSLKDEREKDEVCDIVDDLWFSSGVMHCEQLQTQPEILFTFNDFIQKRVLIPPTMFRFQHPPRTP